MTYRAKAFVEGLRSRTGKIAVAPKASDTLRDATTATLIESAEWVRRVHPDIAFKVAAIQRAPGWQSNQVFGQKILAIGECPVCGKDIDARYMTACSVECAEIVRDPNRPWCAWCGEFMRRRTRLDARTCSGECAGAMRDYELRRFGKSGVPATAGTKVGLRNGERNPGVCAVCGKAFKPFKNQATCSESCRKKRLQAAHRESKRRKRAGLPMKQRGGQPGSMRARRKGS